MLIPMYLCKVFMVLDLRLINWLWLSGDNPFFF